MENRIYAYIDENTVAATVQELNKWEREGWRLVSFFVNPPSAYGKSSHYIAIVGREKKDEQT